jgi:hypothetical protein
MNVSVRALGFAAVAVVFWTSAARAEQVENPQFTAWAKYGVGSAVTLESKMDGGMTMTSTRTLKEKAEDHVVLEVVTVMAMGGKKEPSRPVAQTVQAKLDAKDVKELGKEKVKAGGKTYECTAYAMKDASPNYIGTNPKVWVSPDVPGGVVKVEMSTPKGPVAQVLTRVVEKK